MELDQPKAVRQGEELDGDKLEAYLKKELDLGGDLAVQQFPSGFSNLTYRLELGGREFVMRRPPFGAKIKSGHDMGREYKVLSHLHPVYDKAPEPLLFCGDEAVIGAPFYVMERVQGVILRSSLEQADAPEPEVMKTVAASLIAALAELHKVDVAAAGLNDLGRPEGYVERQVKGWTKRYHDAQTDEIAAIDAVAQWLAGHMPPESGASLIHNDFKYDNVVLDPDNLSTITALLDWEMCTLGDPLMDLGTSLGYWVEKDDPEVMQKLALSPTMLAGNPTRAQVISLYEEATGRQVERPVFYYVYGLFKVAVILQQIYARYKAGTTKDERFAGLIHAVKGCGMMAERALERDRV